MILAGEIEHAATLWVVREKSRHSHGTRIVQNVRQMAIKMS